MYGTKFYSVTFCRTLKDISSFPATILLWVNHQWFERHHNFNAIYITRREFHNGCTPYVSVTSFLQDIFNYGASNQASDNSMTTEVEYFHYETNAFRSRGL